MYFKYIKSKRLNDKKQADKHGLQIRFDFEPYKFDYVFKAIVKFNLN